MDTRTHLLQLQSRLRAAAAMTSCQFARTLALQYLASVNQHLRMPGDLSWAAGKFGENGYGPGIEDAIRDCEARPYETLVDPRAALKRRAA